MSIPCVDFNPIHFPGRSSAGAGRSGLEREPSVDPLGPRLSITAMEENRGTLGLCWVLPSICISSGCSRNSSPAVKWEPGRPREARQEAISRSNGAAAALSLSQASGLYSFLIHYRCCHNKEQEKTHRGQHVRQTCNIKDFELISSSYLGMSYSLKSPCNL